MANPEPTVAGKTLAFGPIEDLLNPALEPGKACFIVIKGRSLGRLYEVNDRTQVIGRAGDVELCIDDPGVSRRHAVVEPSEGGFAVRDLNSTNGLFVNGERVVRHVLRNGDRVQIGTSTILKFCYQDELEESVQKRLYESATRDPLVGIYNRQYLLDALESEYAYCSRHNVPLSFLLLDVDFFKAVNDRHGHLAGDEALKAIAGIAQENLRTEDILARFGGEEFAVLLRYAGEPQASAVAERIRSQVEAHPFAWEGASYRLTVSIGLGTLVDSNYDSSVALVRAADNLLYQAKAAGRNRVFARSSPGASADIAEADSTDSTVRTPRPEA